MNNWAIDLSNGSYQDKVQFLEDHSDKMVLMDLTCFDPIEFYRHFPQLKAVCSTLLSHNNKCELHSEKYYLEASQLLHERGFTSIQSNLLTPGFVVPRTIATIVNEAFFTLEERVANAGDIDRAMIFGVNYPLGPFVWAKGREKIIVQILDLLYRLKNDERYVVSSMLRKQASLI
ncbi:MAG: 3-hydroxyacyl-CoA dehydrogenase family protein [Bacteriovoracia bacterium]